MHSNETDNAVQLPSLPPTPTPVHIAALPTEAELLREFTPRLTMLASRLCGSARHLQEDLFQEGAIGLFEAARRFDPARGAAFATFAEHLMRGRIQHALRAERRHASRFIPMQDLALPVQDGEAEEGGDCWAAAAGLTLGVESMVLKAEWLLLEVALVENLTERQAQIVLLHYHDGLKAAEIAARLQVSAARVSQVLKEAITKLQQALLRN